MRRQRYEVRFTEDAGDQSGWRVWDTRAKGYWAQGVYHFIALPITGFISDKPIAEEQADLIEALAMAMGMIHERRGR